MDKKETTLEEQDHPLKNTDGAFVQVGKNGEPVVPSDMHEKSEQSTKDEWPEADADRH